MNSLIKREAILAMICLYGFLPYAHAQQKTLNYVVMNRNDSIGNMQAIQKLSGDDIVCTVSSKVETRVVMMIKVKLQEESHYHKDKLVLSTSKRTVNDKVKGNKQTKAAADGYALLSEGKESHLNQKSISYDFPMLYFKEPVAISKVYSDYYQKMLSVKTLSNHAYQIDLPEGGSNTYYYENGVCRKVDIHGALFNAQMILQP